MPVQAAKILSVNDLRSQQDHVIRKFFNKMQREAMAIAAHDEYIVASRGTGKSEGVDARFAVAVRMHISVIPTQRFRSYPPSVFTDTWLSFANLLFLSQTLSFNIKTM